MPRVGPRNPCSLPHGFPKGRQTETVKSGAARGVKHVRRAGKVSGLFHDSSVVQSLFNTKPTACRNMRSTRDDVARDLANKRAAIKADHTNMKALLLKYA